MQLPLHVATITLLALVLGLAITIVTQQLCAAVSIRRNDRRAQAAAAEIAGIVAQACARMHDKSGRREL